jgi:imidazolonepropionase-like amidohydrolase
MPAGMLFSDVHVFDGNRFCEGPRWVLAVDGKIVSIETAPIASAGEERHTGGVLFPGFVDAHVHLSFSDAASVVAGGVTAVLDLGEPEVYAFSPHAPLRWRSAGPIITAPGGYPTRSWGANGYGLEVAGRNEATDAVTRLIDHGAAMIKIAIEPGAGPVLDPATIAAIAAAAHARGSKVAAHALGASAVRTALGSGVDVLAHTPVEPLPDDLVVALGSAGVTVISTVRAFGAKSSTIANLRALAEAGCPVAYGTDLGNDGIRPGIDVAELEILEDVLGGREPALAAATSVAGTLAGVDARIAEGVAADLVWCPSFASFADLGRVEVWMGA